MARLVGVSLKSKEIGDFFIEEGSEFLIGRWTDANCIALDVGVSRRHCVINGSHSRWTITDLKSINGVYVNATKISVAQPHEIKFGDEIGIGPGDTYCWKFVVREPVVLSQSNASNSLSYNQSPSRYNFRRSTNETRLKRSARRDKRNKKQLASNSVDLIETEEDDVEKEIVGGRSNKVRAVTRTSHQNRDLTMEKPEMEPGEKIQLKEEINSLTKHIQNIEKERQREITSFKETLIENLTCSVCEELYIGPIVLNCAHVFCKFCIETWQNKCFMETPSFYTCPECRAQVTSAQKLTVLYNIIDPIVQRMSKEFITARKSIVQFRNGTTVHTTKKAVKRRRSRLLSVYPSESVRNEVTIVLNSSEEDHDNSVQTLN